MNEFVTGFAILYVIGLFRGPYCWKVETNYGMLRHITVCYALGVFFLALVK